ncbi:GTPase HflX [Phascolarctobacterium sp. ET69]|uniref:GTPase HflX n=1 Tax=Phascolarctobacterium sp. ET69 TaxID=2939420 RepID=UPI0020137E8F|nr:GTPase HflX [Phascolarctobacterium sp. ET69]MCL1604694.1 GTPase HflX [Phascolarctobacterium sp. ET69]
MREIKGNIKGIRDSVIAELQKLYDMQSPQLVSQELAVKLADITEYINREISVYITRSGQIIEIAVGDNATVELPTFSGRRGAGRLSGIRCIHTHPGGNPYLSGVDISALKNNKYDAMVAIGVASPDFTKSELTFGLITGIDSNENYTAECYGPYSIEDAENINFVNTVSTIERILDKQTGTASLQVMSERAILIGMEWGRNDSLWTVDDSLEELKQLADTAGATVIKKFIQKRPKPDPAFFIGRGKVQELALYAQQENIDLCIFDDELSPAQQRNIESVMGIRILDRTALILDIFAQRARTNEGKLQVELAQLQYTLPRIMGKGLMLSRLGGGIGTRGPGETKLEVDRRRIRDRIAFIKDQIEKVKAVRSLHRSKRKKNNVFEVSLVGYTNAGKSTLLNTLTNSDIYAKDQLFATLDPTTRQLTLPNKQEIIITDTVGFIQRLPHQLIAAFRSTLEVVTEADLLVHVIDVSHELYKEQAAAVHEVLKEIGAETKPVITVYNKIDRLPPDSKLADRLALEEDTVCISAAKKLNLETLQQMIESHLKSKAVEVTLCIPYAETAKAAQLHETANVLEQEYTENGAVMKVILPVEDLEAYNEYILKSE